MPLSPRLGDAVVERVRSPSPVLFREAKSASLIRGGRGILGQSGSFSSAIPTTIGSAPTATVGVDTTGDGRANYVVSGLDTTLSGIPDVLKGTDSPRHIRALSSPTVPTTAAVGVDTTGDGRANYVVSGVDSLGTGIPDALQSPRSRVLANALLPSTSNRYFTNIDGLSNVGVVNTVGTTAVAPTVPTVLTNAGVMGSSAVVPIDQTSYYTADYIQSLELQVRTLTAQVNEKSSLLDHMQSQMKIMQTHVDNASISNSLYDSTLSGKDSRIDELSRALNTKSALITELEMRIADLTSTLASRNEGAVVKEQALSSELQMKMIALQNANTLLAQRDAEIAAKQQEVSCLESSVNALQVRAGMKDSEALAMRLEWDQSVHATLENNMRETLRMKEGLEGDLSQMRLKLSHMEVERNRQDSRMIELEVERSALYARLTEAQSALQMQNTDAKVANEEISRLKGFLQTKTSMVDDLQSKLHLFNRLPTTVLDVSSPPRPVLSPRALLHAQSLSSSPGLNVQPLLSSAQTDPLRVRNMYLGK